MLWSCWFREAQNNASFLVCFVLRSYALRFCVSSTTLTGLTAHTSNQSNFWSHYLQDKHEYTPCRTNTFTCTSIVSYSYSYARIEAILCFFKHHVNVPTELEWSNEISEEKGKKRVKVHLIYILKDITAGCGLWLRLQWGSRLYFQLSINFLIKNLYNGQMLYVG